MKARLSLLVSLILVWTLGIGLFSAWHDSMTTDEGIHTASAYLALTRHEFRFDPEHPYLFKILTALPLLALKPHPPLDDQKLWAAAQPINYDSWQESRSWADNWFYNSGNNADLMIFLARLPAVFLLFATCLGVYLITKAWFNQHVALFALVFTAFNPNLLANGHLTNTDAPLAFAFLICLYTLWRYGQKPTQQTAIIAGIALGIAQITKFSAVSLIPITLIWLAYCAYRSKKYWKALGHVGWLALSAWLVLWLGYGLEISRTLQEVPLINVDHPGVPGTLVTLVNTLRPFFYFFPIDFLKGLTLVFTSTVAGRTTYLLGTTYTTGVPYYFPVLYSLKTQLTGLILLSMGIGQLVYHKVWRHSTPIGFLLATSTFVFALLSITNKLNIGIRHILPLMILFSIYFGLIAEKISQWQFGKKWLIPLVIATYCLPVILNFSNLLGYTNIFVSPATSAYKYFSDSNLDWGQESRQLVVKVHRDYPNQTVYGNYFWSGYALAYYGLTPQSYDPSNPPHGSIFFATATQLAFKEYAYIRTLTPVDHLENNTFFYRLP